MKDIFIGKIGQARKFVRSGSLKMLATFFSRDWDAAYGSSKARM
jgi:hypothetical protein